MSKANNYLLSPRLFHYVTGISILWNDSLKTSITVIWNVCLSGIQRIQNIILQTNLSGAQIMVKAIFPSPYLENPSFHGILLLLELFSLRYRHDFLRLC